MTANLANVLLALPQLNPNDLSQVAGKIKALLSLNGGLPSSNSNQSTVIDYLLEGCHCELRRRGLLGQSSRIPGRLVPPGFKNVSCTVQQALDGYLPGLTNLDRVALGQLAARCLANWLENGSITVTPKILLQNVCNMLVAIDCSFPGYLQDGLLYFCWRKQ